MIILFILYGYDRWAGGGEVTFILPAKNITSLRWDEDMMR